jgi:hypothetical protein
MLQALVRNDLDPDSNAVNESDLHSERHSSPKMMADACLEKKKGGKPEITHQPSKQHQSFNVSLTHSFFFFFFESILIKFRLIGWFISFENNLHYLFSLIVFPG